MPIVTVRLSRKEIAFGTVGLIDTGASYTVIPHGLADVLDLQRFGAHKAFGIGGFIEVFESKVDLDIIVQGKALLSLKDCPVGIIESDLPYVILGRDPIFEHLTFQFRRGELEFVFPDFSEAAVSQPELRIPGADKLAKFVLERRQVIGKLQGLVDSGATEKPEIHNLIKENPWLLGRAYASVLHERTLETILKERFGIKAKGILGGKKRPDVTVMRGIQELVVFEFKKPDIKAGRRELEQIARYVDFLRESTSTTDGTGILRVTGILIVTGFDFKEVGTKEKMNRLAASGITAITWADLLFQARGFIREYLEKLDSHISEEDKA